MTQEEETRLRQNLKIPTARPAVEDGTMEAWLKRLEIVWGMVTITHEEFEVDTKWKISHNRNTNISILNSHGVSKIKFIKEVNDPGMMSLRGKFDIEELKINKISYSRSWVDENSKDKAEQYIIDIDLKEELKKALKKPFWKIW